MPKFFKNNKLIIVQAIFLLITTLFITNSFKPGFILATAEEGIPFYKPEKLFDFYNSFWIEKGLGYSTPFYLARLPFYLLLSMLIKVGITPWLSQAIIFFGLVFVALNYIYKLTSELVESNKSYFLGMFASLFYLLNYFTMSQVWNRFVYYLFFSWAYLPVFLYYWIKFVRTNNLKYLTLFLVFSILFSASFGPPLTLMPFWISVFIFSFVEYLRYKKIKLLINSVVCFTFWMLVNFWWLVPNFNFNESSYAGILGESSIISLKAVSSYYTNSDIMQLKQKYYFDRGGYFDTFSGEKINSVISMGFVFLVFIGIVKLFRGKRGIYVIVLFLLSFFLAKGSNPPLGDQFYKFLFDKFPYTQVLRNPYEKVGLLLVLANSVLFAVGAATVSNISKAKLKFGILLLLFLSLIILGRPILQGKVFYEHYRVKVPNDYYEINKLVERNVDKRIFHIPLHLNPGIQFTWGYVGDEPSSFLFENASISQVGYFAQTDKFVSKLPAYFENPNITNLLSLMSVKYILCHGDYVQDNEYTVWMNIYQCGNNVESWNNTKMLYSSNNLLLYEIEEQSTNNRVYVSNKLIKASSMNHLMEIATSDNFDVKSTSLYLEIDGKYKNIHEMYYLELPNIVSEQINSQNYIVRVKNATRPYVLVMSNAFDDGWIAESENELFSSHFAANGITNGWVIDKVGSYSIKLTYQYFR